MSMFSAQGLSKRFGRREVVQQVSLEVDPGEIVGLLGANGAGKSTTFRMIIGLLKPNGGSISFLNQDITPMPMHQRARMGLGYLAQEPTVFAHLSVADNILMVLEHYYPKSEHADRLERLLAELALTRLRDSKAGSLSGVSVDV